MDIVKNCQHCFSFEMPSNLWENRARMFDCKFTEFCQYIPQSSFCLFICLLICLVVYSFVLFLLSLYHAFGEKKVYSPVDTSLSVFSHLSPLTSNFRHYMPIIQTCHHKLRTWAYGNYVGSTINLQKTVFLKGMQVVLFIYSVPSRCSQLLQCCTYDLTLDPWLR